MNEKMLTDLKDMRINITSEMKDLFIKLLVIKQTLDDNKELSFKDKKVLQKEFDKLLKIFIKDFQANNIVQVQIIRTFLNGK